MQMTWLNKTYQRRLPAHLVLAAALAACLCTADQGQAAPAQKAQVSAAPSAQKKPVVKTPVQVSRELVARLKTGKLPWQFYTHYVEKYRGFAEMIRGMVNEKTPKARAQRLRELAAYYDELGNAVEGMTANQRVMDGIRLNNTKVPYGERRSVYQEARAKHQQMTVSLIHRLQNPPGKEGAESDAAGAENAPLELPPTGQGGLFVEPGQNTP